MNIGIIRFNTNDYSIALEKFQKVEFLFQQSKDGSQPRDTNCNRPLFVIVYNSIGIICEKQDMYEEAIKYYVIKVI
jgi:hypothetical protein